MPQLLHAFDVLNIIATNPAFVEQIGVMKDINTVSDTFVQQAIDTLAAASKTPILAEVMVFVAMPTILAIVAFFYCCCGMPCCVCCSSEYQFEAQAEVLVKQAKVCDVTDEMTEDTYQTMKQKKYFRLLHQNEELRAKARRYNYFFVVPFILWFFGALAMIILLAQFYAQFKAVFKQQTVNEITRSGRDMYDYGLQIIGPADAFLEKSCGYQPQSLQCLFEDDEEAYKRSTAQFSSAPGNFLFSSQVSDNFLLHKGANVVFPVFRSISEDLALPPEDPNLLNSKNRIRTFFSEARPLLQGFGLDNSLFDKIGGAMVSWEVAVIRTLCEIGVFSADCPSIDEAFLAEENSLGALDSIYRKVYKKLAAIVATDDVDELLAALKDLNAQIPFSSELEFKTFWNDFLQRFNMPFQQFSDLLAKDVVRTLLLLLPNMEMLTMDAIMSFIDGECIQIARNGQRISCGVHSDGASVDLRILLPADLSNIVSGSSEIVKQLSNLKIAIYNMSQQMNNAELGLATSSFIDVLNGVAQKVNQAQMPQFSAQTFLQLSQAGAIFVLAVGTLSSLIVAIGCMACRSQWFAKCSLACSGFGQLARALCACLFALLAVALLCVVGVTQALKALPETADAFFASQEYTIQRVSWARSLQEKIDTSELFMQDFSRFGIEIHAPRLDFSTKADFLRSTALGLSFDPEKIAEIAGILRIPEQLHADLGFILCNAFFTEAPLPPQCTPLNDYQPQFTGSQTVVAVLKGLARLLDFKPGNFDTIFEQYERLIADLQSTVRQVQNFGGKIEIGLSNRFFAIFSGNSSLLNGLRVQITTKGGRLHEISLVTALQEFLGTIQPIFAVPSDFDADMIDKLRQISIQRLVDFSAAASTVEALISDFAAKIATYMGDALPWAKNPTIDALQDTLASFALSRFSDIVDSLKSKLQDPSNLYSIDNLLLFLYDEIQGMSNPAHFNCQNSSAAGFSLNCKPFSQLSGPDSDYRSISSGDFPQLKQFWLSGKIRLGDGITSDFQLKTDIFSNNNIMQNRFRLDADQPEFNTLGIRVETLCNDYRAAISQLLAILQQFPGITVPDDLPPIVSAFWGFEANRLDQNESPVRQYIDILGHDASNLVLVAQNYVRSVYSTTFEASEDYFRASPRLWTLGDAGNLFLLPSVQFLDASTSLLLSAKIINGPAQRVSQIAQPFADIFCGLHYYQFCFWAMALIQPILAAISWPYLSSKTYDKHEERRNQRAERRAELRRQALEKKNQQIMRDMEEHGQGVIIVDNPEQLAQIMQENEGEVVDYAGVVAQQNEDVDNMLAVQEDIEIAAVIAPDDEDSDRNIWGDVPE